MAKSRGLRIQSVNHVFALTLTFNLGLPDAYRFVQCHEDEPIIAIQDGTGKTIVWTKDGWVGYRIVKQEDES